MSGLEALLALRNARLRAWRAVGVGVEGGWKLQPDSIAHLKVKCLTCGKSTSMRGRLSSEVKLLYAERIALHQGCEHLKPLLGEDSPEVQDLTQLELLAGPG